MQIESPFSEVDPAFRRRLLAATPDTSTNVEARGFQLREDTLAYRADASSTDLLLRSPLFRVSLPIGQPTVKLVRSVLREDKEPWTVVAATEQIDAIHEAIPDWDFELARIAERPETVPPLVAPAVGDGIEIRPLDPRDRAAVDSIPDEEVRDEVGRLLGYVPYVAAFVDERPVSLCGGYPETETHFDLAIDTLEGFRRCGLARATATALIHAMAERGKRPVWGAVESNTASIRLAESLDFEWVGKLGVWAAPGQY